jgi:hypothetical protein
VADGFQIIRIADCDSCLFLSESIAKCFKHKYSKRFYLLMSPMLLFLLLLCVIFVPAILVTCYLAVNVNLYSYSCLFNNLPLLQQETGRPSFLLLEFYFWFWVLGCLFLYILVAAHSFLTQNSSKLGTGLEIIFLHCQCLIWFGILKRKMNELDRLALVRAEEMNDLKTYFFI